MGKSRKEQKQLQEVKAALKEYEQQQQKQQLQQQQQQQGGTSYGIPAKPNTLPPYSEAVKGLDDILVCGRVCVHAGVRLRWMRVQGHMFHVWSGAAFARVCGSREHVRCMYGANAHICLEVEGAGCKCVCV